jgi:hypothetical protein
LKSINYNFLILVSFCASVIFFGCKKDHSVLGVDVQPTSDALNASFSDTCMIYAHTLTYDRVSSFNDRYKFLGSNHDPVFGRTDVGLYLNANIPNGLTGGSFGDDPNLVSAEIILTIATLDFVGSNTVALNYSVFPISTALDKSVVYYSGNDSLHNKNSVLANYTGTYSILNQKLVLRIPIDPNFASSILNNSGYLADNATFLSTYKGFYITCSGSNLNPVNAQGVIAKFDLEDALSGFYLYYQNGTPSATKQNKTYQFTFSGNDVVRFNTFKYRTGDLSPGTSLYQQVVKKDSTFGKENLFLKGLGGTKVRLYMPGLKHYSDSFPIGVDRAEVIFNLDPAFVTTTGQYLPPAKLALLPISSDGRELFALDQLNTTDLDRYNGNYDYTNNQYVFNIARHVQAILRGTVVNNGFYLVVADPSPLYTSRRDNYAERIVLAGSNNALLKPKFNLTYVKLKNDKP